jgi:hypothetical protein
MKINRQNYELFAIDFIDGKMSPSEAAVFIAFLADNPDISQEIELMREVDTVVVSQFQEQNFSYLMKNYDQIGVNENTFEELCIAYHEGDLNPEMQQKLFEYASLKPERQKRLETYGQLKIIPDTSIKYHAKSDLKQKVALRQNYRRAALVATFAVAASLAVVFMLRNIHPVSNTLVDNETTRITLDTGNHRQNQVIPSPVKTAAINQDKPEAEPQRASRKILSDPNDNPLKGATLAAINDSTDSNDTDVIRIANLDPKPVHIQKTPEQLAIALPRAEIRPLHSEDVVEPIEEIREKTNELVTKASRISVDEIIKTGINGLNTIAETGLNYQSSTDKKGRIIEFALSSETFNIKRRIRNN